MLLKHRNCQKRLIVTQNNSKSRHSESKPWSSVNLSTKQILGSATQQLDQVVTFHENLEPVSDMSHKFHFDAFQTIVVGTLQQTLELSHLQAIQLTTQITRSVLQLLQSTLTRLSSLISTGKILFTLSTSLALFYWRPGWYNILLTIVKSVFCNVLIWNS